MSLQELRKEIDSIDAALVELLNRRATTAIQIGEEKRRRQTGIHDPVREDAVLQHVEALNRGPLTHAALQELFVRIIGLCSQIQQDTNPGGTVAQSDGIRE